MSIRSQVSLPPEVLASPPSVPAYQEQPVAATPLPPAPEPSPWTPAELKSVAHLGPGVIGAEMFAAAQAYLKSSQNGILGPATRGA